MSVTASWDLPLKKLLGDTGPLREKLPGFQPRSQQIALAKAVDDALKKGKPCLAEAGTGVGKTFAYLLPIARWLQETDGCAVVSTHTLALQSQLVERDIPLLMQAIPEWDIRPAVLKGRSNFLCLQDLEAASADLTLRGDDKFQQIQRWSQTTESGDVAELPFTFPMWSEIAANADTCRQRECRFYDRCFYFKMRKNAEDCNLIVVNHALFFADLRLRQANTGGPTLIPHYDAVVFDEAHHVEDMATRAFGLEWGSRRVPNLLNRVRKMGDKIEMMTVAAIEALNQRALDPFLQSESPEAFVDELLNSPGERQMFADLRGELCAALDGLAKQLSDVSEAENDVTERDRAGGLARIATRISTELAQVSQWDDDAESNADGVAYFRWYQTRKMRGNQSLTTLTRTPLTIDKPLQNALLANTPRIIMTSATLATGGGFDYLKKRMGMTGTADDATAFAPVEVIEGSPFDFQKNCLLYIPRHLGTPTGGYGNTNGYDNYGGGNGGRANLRFDGGGHTDRLSDMVLNLVEAAQGRTFALFTSHRMLREVHDRLLDRCDYPIFVQGDMPNGRLVEEFVTAGNGVLLGTSSFWEGVDVRGAALSCVIMDKLPFATPSAPMQRAREADIKAHGGDSFREFSIPQAQLRLKQGFGRLLRGMEDRGVVAILDERLWTKSYGRLFLSDLPPCPVSDDFADVERFFADMPMQNIESTVRDMPDIDESV